jgi:hypothetical protein
MQLFDIFQSKVLTFFHIKISGFNANFFMNILQNLKPNICYKLIKMQMKYTQSLETFIHFIEE